MTEPIWLPRTVVEDIHSEQLGRHGGSAGIRDIGLLESALARPQSVAACARQEPPPSDPRCQTVEHQEQQSMTSSPMAIWTSGFDAWRMLAEAQTVVALRMMGMAGLWTLAEGETTRMVTEKQQAFAQSALDGAVAAMRGQSPDLILAAVVGPLGRKTSANARRLGRSYYGQFCRGR